MRLILCLALLPLLTGCMTTPAPSKLQTVTSYYEGLNAADFERVRHVLADSITLIEGDYAIPMSMDAYYVIFQWDSVFATQNEIHESTEEDNKVVATVSSSSKRFNYLQDELRVCITTFGFKEGKISSLETGECPGEDRALWEARRDTLVTWVDRNHPELSGFIHDLTKAGAERYVQAIDLYEEQYPQQ